MLAAVLTLSIFEIALLLFGAIVLGITIHFFIASRKTLKNDSGQIEKLNQAKDEWKLRYFNDIELRDKDISLLKQKAQEAKENAEIYAIEAEEMSLQNRKLKTELQAAKNSGENSDTYIQTIEELRRQNKQLQEEVQMARQVIPEHIQDKPDYLEQLRMAQKSLLEHNQKINDLLGNIDVIKEKEEKEREILRDNEELSGQISHLRMELSEKDKEIHNIHQQEHLTKEMTSMLDSAYSEFNVLQSKIQKMEAQLTASKMLSLEYEDLKEVNTKISRDLEEQKQKAYALSTENQQLQNQLMDTEDKFREANFQRQQMQKRVAYLEELNMDLQVVSDTNKKLEGQLKRIGELESLLNVVSEERDILEKRQDK